MNKSFWLSAFKSNWYLVLALIAVVIAGLFMAIRPEEEKEEAVSQEVATDATNVSAQKPGLASSAVPATPSAAFKPASKEHQARIDIQHYMKKLLEDPHGEETPRNLQRMANLYYSSLLDYGQAAYYYEDLLHRFPGWKLNDNVFTNLALCYERLNDPEKLRWTYERMIERFPESSPHHQFAKEKMLGR